MSNHLLRVQDLSVDVNRKSDSLRILDGVDLEVRRNQIVGLVGESGCGKTITARAVLGLTDPPLQVSSGEIYWKGAPLLQQSQSAWQDFRGTKAAMIPQQAEAALDPRSKVGEQLARLLRFHHGASGQEAHQRVSQLLDQVMLGAEETADQYPSQLSGGQQQRVAIAMALACSPELLIADEPTSGLDTTIRPHLISLYRRLSDERDLSVLIISHDMGVIANVCDYLYVMYLGRIVEHGPIDDVFENPLHPYTRMLLHSVPLPEPGQYRDQGAQLVDGDLPTFENIPSGCRFRTRCPEAFGKCSRVDPPLYQAENGRGAACLLHEQETEPHDGREAGTIDVEQSSQSA